MTQAWVVGGGGLLGSALRRALAADPDVTLFQAPRLAWSDPAEAARQLDAAAEAFGRALAPQQRWQILWAAGTGSMGSAVPSMALETQHLQRLLASVAGQPTLASRAGSVLLASSAGAIYAGCRDSVITERSAVAATTPYAMAKLEQERLAAQFAAEHAAVTLLVARFSTLYGPGQTASKPQGIISHIARCMVRNRPVQIFVPYDTIRDYLYIDDAARLALRALARAERCGAGVVTKIVAAQSPCTIAEIISIFKRLARRPPRIVTSASALSRLYTRRVVFRSVVLPLADQPVTEPVLGIARVLQAERRLFAQGPR